MGGNETEPENKIREKKKNETKLPRCVLEIKSSHCPLSFEKEKVLSPPILLLPSFLYLLSLSKALLQSRLLHLSQLPAVACIVAPKRACVRVRVFASPKCRLNLHRLKCFVLFFFTPPYIVIFHNRLPPSLTRHFTPPPPSSLKRVDRHRGRANPVRTTGAKQRQDKWSVRYCPHAAESGRKYLPPLFFGQL